MTAMIITKNLSKVNTASVCECYLKGDIVEMPKLHIDKMMKVLNNCMKYYTPVGSYCQRIIGFDERSDSDIRLMIDMYLRYTYRNRNLKRTTNSKPDYKIKLAIKNSTKLASGIAEYYENIEHYRVGSIDFEGQKLDIYFNIPINYRHYSLTCFYTDPESMNQYCFKNLNDILPSDELSEQFLLQLPPQRNQVKYSF
jgi:hypothetical protein